MNKKEKDRIFIIGDKYVMKAITTKDDFEREYDIHMYCAKHNIAPKIIKVGQLKLKGKDYWYIIMKRYGTTLFDYIHNQKNKKIRADDFDKIKEVIEKMHEIGVYHEDLHEGNIMFDVDGKNIKNIKIIDFGLSSKYNKPLRSSNNLPFNKRNQIYNYEIFERLLNLKFPAGMRNNWHQLKYIERKYVSPSTPHKAKRTPQKIESLKAKRTPQKIESLKAKRTLIF